MSYIFEHMRMCVCSFGCFYVCMWVHVYAPASPGVMSLSPLIAFLNHSPPPFFEAVSLSEFVAHGVLLPGQWAPGVLSLLHPCARVKGVQLWQDFYMDSGNPNPGICVFVGLHFTNGAIFLARHLRCRSVLYVIRDRNNCEQPVFVCFWFLQLIKYLWETSLWQVP